MSTITHYSEKLCEFSDEKCQSFRSSPCSACVWTSAPCHCGHRGHSCPHTEDCWKGPDLSDWIAVTSPTPAGTAELYPVPGIYSYSGQSPDIRGIRRRREMGTVKNNNAQAALKNCPLYYLRKIKRTKTHSIKCLKKLTAGWQVNLPCCVQLFVVDSWKGKCWTQGPTCCRSARWGTSLWTRRLLGTAPLTAIRSSRTAKIGETAQDRTDDFSFISFSLLTWYGF